MKDFFNRLISDDNSINEKTIIGIASFIIMVVYAIVALVPQIWGGTVEINEIIYESFMSITLISFGISSIQSIGTQNKKQ